MPAPRRAFPLGSYEFKVVLNESFSPAAFGLVGFAGGGGNLSFAVIASTDNLTFTLDANTGRVKVTNDNPLASAGPPFFAQSTAWSTAYDSSTQLYDDGTNGDATNGDNIYSRTFTVAAAGAHTVRVRQGHRPSVPGLRRLSLRDTHGQPVYPRRARS
jgi:hypothetical protein